MLDICTWRNLVPFAGSVVAFTVDPLPVMDYEETRLQTSHCSLEIPYFQWTEDHLYFAYVRPNWVYSGFGEPGYEVLDLPDAYASSINPLVSRHHADRDMIEPDKTERLTAGPLWTTSYIQLFLHAQATNLRMRKATEVELEAIDRYFASTHSHPLTSSKAFLGMGHATPWQSLSAVASCV